MGSLVMPGMVGATMLRPHNVGIELPALTICFIISSTSELVTQYILQDAQLPLPWKNLEGLKSRLLFK